MIRSINRPAAEKRIEVMSFGDGGVRILEDVAARFENVALTAVNTDAKGLESSPIGEKLAIGELATRGMGAGGDPRLGERAALQDEERLRRAVSGADVLFLLACLGGGTGTGCLPVAARFAMEEGVPVAALVTTPFRLEGPKRIAQAAEALQTLRRSVGAVAVLPNEKIMKRLDPKYSVREAYGHINEAVGEVLRSIIGLLRFPNLLQIDFADVRSVLSQGGESMVGWGEGRGEKRIEKALERALDGPLLRREDLASCFSLFASVRGGGDLSLFEVHKALEQVLPQFLDESRLTLGAVANGGRNGSVDVTLLALRKDPFPRPATARVWTEQTVLEFGTVEKGRFSMVEPTLYEGEDLDIPTFIRKRQS